MIRYLLIFLIVVNSVYAMSAEDKAFFADLARQKAERKAREKAKKEKKLKLNAKRVNDAIKKSSGSFVKTDIDMRKRERKIKEIMDAAKYLEKRLEAKKKLLAARNRVKLLNDLLKTGDSSRYKINLSQIQNIFSLGTKQTIVLTGASLNKILNYVVNDFSTKQALKKGISDTIMSKSTKKVKSTAFGSSASLGYAPNEQITLSNGDLITYSSDYTINFIRVENSYAIFKIALK